jgi:hypothetical protein
MPVRTRRMRNFGKGVRLPEGISSSEEDIEMSPLAKNMVDELQSYMDARIQEKMEALNENVRTEPPMVQKEDMAQLMKKIEQTVSQNMTTLEQAMSKKMATLIQGMSQ